MSNVERGAYYRELKAAGMTFERSFQAYTEDELKAMLDAYRAAAGQPSVDEEPPEEIAVRMAERLAEKPAPAPKPAPPRPAPQPVHVPKIAGEELPGARLNTRAEDEPIEVDENGLIWYQKEVRKPGYAKPRGRRILRYKDPGTKVNTVQDGQFTESFEVAGDRQIPAEVKITLPSYQVGIYKDPRMPFRIHIYNEQRGFDYFEVNDYYGGEERVPWGIKKIYISNVLCYDIRTVVLAIEEEYRRNVLNQKELYL